MGRTIAPNHAESHLMELAIEEEHHREAEKKAAIKVQSIQRQRMAMREAELKRHTQKAHEIHIMEDHEGAQHAQKIFEQKQQQMDTAVFDDRLEKAKKMQA